MSISIAVLTVHCLIPNCTSLKQKRSVIRPLLARLHHEFNISAAEVDHHDIHGSTIISCACISNDPNHSRRVLQNVFTFIIDNFKNIEMVEESIEFI